MFKFVMMKTKLVIILIILLLTNSKNYAQVNHVLNPSFEQLKYVDTITPWLNQVEQVWHGTDSTNDVWNAVVMYTYRNLYGMLPIPNPSWGGGGVYQYPRSGKVAINLSAYNDTPILGYRYAVGQLDEQMMIGHQYCITLYSNLAKPLAEGIANNRICAYVGDKNLDTIQNTHGKLIHYFTPQLTCDSIVKDTQNWTKEQATFIATGNESRIILGNFYYNYQTSVYTIDPNGARTSEYFIDDVSVVESTAKIIAGNDTTINQGDTVVLGKGITDGLPCDWFTLNGTPVYRGSMPEVTPATTTTYVVKMDLCGNVTYDTMTVHVIPTGMQQVTSGKEQMMVYPNPCGDELIISNYQLVIKQLEVIDLLGKVMLTKEVSPTYNLRLTTENLPLGIYFLKATDEKGFVHTAKFVKD